MPPPTSCQARPRGAPPPLHNLCMPDTDKDFWDPNDVAEYLGVEVETVHVYRVRSRWEAEQGTPPEERKGLPKEDHMLGRTPVWKPQTIIDYKAGKPPMTQGDVDAGYWTMDDIAAFLGVKLKSVHVYRQRGRNEERDDVPAAERRGLPKEDRMYGRTPVWKPQTIVTWQREQRPGQGVGGGRPTHRQHS